MIDDKGQTPARCTRRRLLETVTVERPRCPKCGGASRTLGRCGAGRYGIISILRHNRSVVRSSPFHPLEETSVIPKVRGTGGRKRSVRTLPTTARYRRPDRGQSGTCAAERRRTSGIAAVRPSRSQVGDDVCTAQVSVPCHRSWFATPARHTCRTH